MKTIAFCRTLFAASLLAAAAAPAQSGGDRALALDAANGDDRAALGLAGVALKAGVRGALATLWNIIDVAWVKLIAAFCQGLRSGMSKAQALRQAQWNVGADRGYAHPAFWAPFLIIGNWL